MICQIPTPKLTSYIAHRPEPKQYIFLCMDDVLDVFFGGAAGGGKSDALLMAALQYVDCPDYNAILIRDTVKNLTMPGALLERSHEWLHGTDAHWIGDKRRWIFPSGATLNFGYIDGPNDHFNFQSSEFQFVGIDEAVNIREHQALYPFSRLRKLEGSDIPIRFRVASNPPTREQLERGSWVKRRYVDPKTRAPGVKFVPSKLSDNKYLNAEDYEKSLNNLDPITREQLLKGNWDIQAKGNMFDRTWFEIVDESPIESQRVRFWDLAATEATANNDPDWTCGVKIAKTTEGILYIESVVRARKDPRHVEMLIRQVADMDGKNTHIKMEQEPGSGGKNTIDYYRRKVLPDFVFSGERSTGSKTSRAMPFSSYAEAGNIKLVAGPWIHDFLEEIELFPYGKYLDQVDAAAGAFNYLVGARAEPRIRII